MIVKRETLEMIKLPPHLSQSYSICSAYHSRYLKASSSFLVDLLSFVSLSYQLPSYFHLESLRFTQTAFCINFAP